MKVFLDLDQDNERIIVRYKYHKDIPAAMRQVVGLKIKQKGKDPHPDEIYYYGKLTLDVARDIRRVFGDGVSMTDELRKWAAEEKRRTGAIRKLSLSEDAELKLVPELLPELYQLIDTGSAVTLLGENKPKGLDGKPRSFQKADIAFAAAKGKSCNFNHAGLGKTIEVIGAIAESGRLHGSHLIACPVVSKNSVWEHEWLSWVRDVPILVTPEGRAARTAMLRDAKRRHEAGKPFALVVNPAMIKYRSEFTKCAMHEGDLCQDCGAPQGLNHRDSHGHRFRRGKGAKVQDMRNCEYGCIEKLVPEYDELFEIDWDWVVLDEVQKMGVYNMASMTYKALLKLPCKNKVLMSGTPFAGKAIHVFHILKLMDSKEFSNKMDFANLWLTVTADNNPFTSGKALNIGELRSCPKHPLLKSDEDNECPDCEAVRQPFWDMLSTHAVRRTKKEYLQDLPDKNYIEKWVEMTPAQKKQYEQFAAEAALTIGEYEIGAVGVLAEYTRLKQFANAVQTVEILEPATIEHPMKYKLTPTEDSPKLPQIMEILDDLGIVNDEPVGGQYEKAVVFSESAEMVKMVTGYLKKSGIPAEMILGGMPQTRRSALQAEFQAEGGVKVMVVSTLAAGFSINLDRASTVIFLDETWNPDDQEQAEDRCHRGSRNHQVNVYYIRTKGTIQGEVKDTVLRKAGVNKGILNMKNKAKVTQDPETD